MEKSENAALYVYRLDLPLRSKYLSPTRLITTGSEACARYDIKTCLSPIYYLPSTLATMPSYDTLRSPRSNVSQSATRSNYRIGPFR